MTTTTADVRVPDAFVPRRIPFSRLVRVELIKMFDTRSGFWLMASIAGTALLATLAVIVFAPDQSLTYNSFGAAIGIPMTVLLPVVAILSVTSEWSQRSGLTTFALIPHRGRVIGAKLVCALGVGIASMALALAIGAVGNVVGSAAAGVDTVWDVSTSQMLQLVLVNVINLLVGFMLGVLFRSSAVAIVAYFVYGFVLFPLTELLAASQEWFRDLRPWVDFNYTTNFLYDGLISGERWANLAVVSTIWLVLPLALGLALVARSEVK